MEKLKQISLHFENHTFGGKRVKIVLFINLYTILFFVFNFYIF